jgi:subtilisin-like proprotein convertase family protein
MPSDVGPSNAQAQTTFASSGPITIGGGGAVGPAAPYPSTIEVSGVSGTITSAVVTLIGLSHTSPQDVDILLVGPTGANVVLMSDVGGATAVNGINLILSDSAAAPLPAAGLATGTFQPTNLAAGADVFPSPAPSPSGVTQLAVFTNSDPNGTWELFVVDDEAGNAGVLTSWTLTFTLAALPSTSTPTSAPSVVGLADVSLGVTTNTNPVPSGQNLSYFATVRNSGTVSTPQFWLTAQIPGGTTVASLAAGCFEDPSAGLIRCPVSPLSSGAQASFTLVLNVTAPGGTLTSRFTADPENLVTESDESNNVVDRTVNVSPVGTPPVPTFTPVPTPLPPTPAPAPTPPPAAPELWLQVLAETPATDTAGTVLWVCAPGEWYLVLDQQGGWAYGPWEFDPPANSVWIEIDARVELAVY